ncbi:uncharacterized protein LOC124153571 [Ischnura elegans]|uniref:uncharacterized protein LOC124153571 n=1 Tax=Ischnura elegans TaxID=197161 RepID=UPI001ED8BEA8|nr:uncharacterized protein LOC124153571 [Ischnura elegans]
MMRGKRIGVIFILVLLISQSSGQKFSFGTCPTVTSLAGLMIDMISTTWREYARTPSVHTHSWQCTLYTITTVNSMISYSLSITGQNKVTQQTFTVVGTITAGGAAADAATVAATFLTFQVPSYYTTKTANYYIIDGADAAYLVLYSCENVLFGKVESVIILTTATATSANIQSALTAVSNVGYPLHALRRGYQGCID